MRLTRNAPRLRVVADEGLLRALRFAFNVLRDDEARRRVFEMRRVFRRHRRQIAAAAVITASSAS
jgi:hypothetical protein